MKKCFMIGLIMAMVPGMCPAVYTRISDLTAEKIAKMKKLEKCQGTTKGLKIAGLSTLGLTAVGVAGNIAEAVVLNEYKDKVKKEKTELGKQKDLNKQLKDQRNAQLAANQPQTADSKDGVKKYGSFAECYEACQKPARCEIRSEAQPDFSVKTWYECVTDSKTTAEIQLVHDFENQSVAPVDALKNISNWEIIHEKMSECDEPNFTDNSILCHAKKDNTAYKFLFKELETNETGFTEENACKAQCKTTFGCFQSSVDKRWQCVADLPENSIQIADYKPFTDGVKCMEYCAETCEYVAATKHSPVLYRCYKSKEKAAEEQKQRAELDEKAEEMYLPRLAGIREKYVKATNECMNNESCPQTNMTDLAKAYREDFNKIVAETDKVKDFVTPFDKNQQASIVEDTITLQENNYRVKNKSQSAVTNSKTDQSISASDKEKFNKMADSYLERADKKIDELQKKYCKNCSTECNMHYYKFKDGSEFIGVSCPDDNQEKFYDDKGVEIQKPVEKTQPAPSGEDKLVPELLRELEQPKTITTRISGERPMIGEAGVKGVYTEIQEYSKANDLSLNPVVDCNQSGNTFTCGSPRNKNTYVFNVDNIVAAGVLTKRAKEQTQERAQEIKLESNNMHSALGRPYNK